MNKGLTSDEVEKSRAQHGSNILTPPEKESLWKLFLGKFNDPIIRILLIAAFLSLAIALVDGHYYETIGIFCAIFLATGISFWFEMDAGRKFDILNQVNDDTPVKVLRQGNVTQVGKKDIVVGDIILLEQGDEIPADARLIDSIAMEVDESSLTGEPSMAKTHIEEDFKTDTTYPSDMILRGSTVIEGHGAARVERVGDATEFGKVARQSAEKTHEITPLTRQLDKLAKLIGVIGFSLAIITFLSLFLKDIFGSESDFTLGQIGLLGAVMAGVSVALTKVWFPFVYDAMQFFGSKKKMPRVVAKWNWLVWTLLGIVTFAVMAGIGWLFGVNPLDPAQWISIEEAGQILSYFMIAVTLIVVAVPEGLPMSVTLSLALSMRKMLKSNNLVRKMHATETMGATTVICTDKTGTLTRNQMTVSEANFADKSLEPFVLEGIAVNSTANLDFADPEHPKPLGNPTEGALLLWLNSQDYDYKAARVDNRLISQLPFSTRHKYMASEVKSSAASGKNILYIKGAPEMVLAKCKNVVDTRKSIQEKLLEYQNKAMRTLAFAYMETEGDFSEALTPEKIDEVCGDNFTFLGFVAISDPVRDDVPAAVGECMSAGIAVKIVTGDTPGTAREIGRQIGLWLDSDTDINAITGPEFEALSDEEAYERAGVLKIMARARPTDKQRLVQLLQKRGEVVAVTGDGTNDAPALNFANVGLSMGTGTSVAKEASDITLLDDSFASIASAVMWGRSLYLNIQRFVLFQLTINVAALSVVFLGSLLGFELPLTVTQMLWVNLIMDTFAAGALASLPPDKKVMKEKPRRKDDFIITRIMGRSILGVGLAFVAILLALLYVFSTTGEGLTLYKMSMFFTVFVMLQFWNMFNAKAYHTGESAFHNMRNSLGFVAVLFLILLGQILIVTYGGTVFRVTPLKVDDWLIIIGATSTVLWVGEIFRLIGKFRKGK